MLQNTLTQYRDSVNCLQNSDQFNQILLCIKELKNDIHSISKELIEIRSELKHVNLKLGVHVNMILTLSKQEYNSPLLMIVYPTKLNVLNTTHRKI